MVDNIHWLCSWYRGVGREGWRFPFVGRKKQRRNGRCELSRIVAPDEDAEDEDTRWRETREMQYETHIRFDHAGAHRNRDTVKGDWCIKRQFYTRISCSIELKLASCEVHNQAQYLLLPLFLLRLPPSRLFHFHRSCTTSEFQTLLFLNNPTLRQIHSLLLSLLALWTIAATISQR